MASEIDSASVLAAKERTHHSKAEEANGYVLSVLEEVLPGINHLQPGVFT